MRSKNQDLTPREEALLILMGWARAAYNGLTNDLYEVDDRDSFRVQVRSALAKEHNRLAARVSGCEDVLDAEEKYLPNSVSSTEKYSRKE